MKKQQIFVSSVQKELAIERRVIRDFIRGDALFNQYFDVFLFEDLVDKGVLDQRGTRGPGVHYVLAMNRNKIGTKGTFSADTPNRDNSGTKGTSAKPDNKKP